MAPRLLADPSSLGWKPRALDGFVGLLGPLWTRREGEGWAYGFMTGEKHANPAGIVHGGMLVTLVDHALNAIAWEAVDRKPCFTIQLDTRFLAVVRPGDFVEARGRVVRRASSLVFVQGTLAVSGGEVMTASAIVKTVRAA